MIRFLRKGWRRSLGRLAPLENEATANGHRLDHLSWQVDQLHREMRLLLGQLSLPSTELWADRRGVEGGGPAVNAFPLSSMCRQTSFEQPYFAYWTGRLGSHFAYHRKLWEYVFICQALWERGVIRSGARGLGFGVGREPLAAYFASEGCHVLGTDLPSDGAVAQGWSHTVQHADGLEALRHSPICPDAIFDAQVAFRVCDMNAVPDDICAFDFCWSACALEHLGSIEQGLGFIERSIQCVKPGGWVVHTTEYNVSSNDLTVDNNGTVLFRRQDLERLAARLAARGHEVAPFDFNSGLAPLDRYIDVPPYRSEPHLKLAISGFATTSMGIIVQRAS